KKTSSRVRGGFHASDRSSAGSAHALAMDLTAVPVQGLVEVVLFLLGELAIVHARLDAVLLVFQAVVDLVDTGMPRDVGLRCGLGHRGTRGERGGHQQSHQAVAKRRLCIHEQEPRSIVGGLNLFRKKPHPCTAGGRIRASWPKARPSALEISETPF